MCNSAYDNVTLLKLVIDFSAPLDINTQNSELSNVEFQKSVAITFLLSAKENQDKVPTLYWLPKLHKNPYKARFIANSSSCMATELSKLLNLCLTALKTCYQVL